MVVQLKTFQGVRYSLFNFNTDESPGGYADFDRFKVDEPHPNGLMKPIPFGRGITLTNVAAGSMLTIGGAKEFMVVDRGLGRVALEAGGKYVSAGKGQVVLKAGAPGDAETFQWTETPYGDLVLLSLATHRHLSVDPRTGVITADNPGPKPDRKDGSCFSWAFYFGVDSRVINPAAGAN
jgi:hypothetical protein